MRVSRQEARGKRQEGFWTLGRLRVCTRERHGRVRRSCLLPLASCLRSSRDLFADVEEGLEGGVDLALVGDDHGDEVLVLDAGEDAHEGGRGAVAVLVDLAVAEDVAAFEQRVNELE